MKKYKVLRDYPYYKAGHIFTANNNNEINEDGQYYSENHIEYLVKEGWLAEVPEKKELWEKLYERTQLLIAEDKKECKEVAKIARQHFLEVAWSAIKKYQDDSIENPKEYRTSAQYIIQAIEKDGEK